MTVIQKSILAIRILDQKWNMKHVALYLFLILVANVVYNLNRLENVFCETETSHARQYRGHGSRVVTSVAFPLILRSRVRIPAVGAFGKLHPLL